MLVGAVFNQRVCVTRVASVDSSLVVIHRGFFTCCKTNLIWKHGHKKIPAYDFFTPLVRQFRLGFFPLTARSQYTRPRRPGWAVLSLKHATSLSASKDKKLKVSLPPDSRDHLGKSTTDIIPQSSDKLACLRLQKETEALQIERLQLELQLTQLKLQDTLPCREKVDKQPGENQLVISNPLKRSLLCKTGLTSLFQVSLSSFMNS